MQDTSLREISICRIYPAEKCPYARYITKRDVHIQDVSCIDMLYAGYILQIDVHMQETSRRRMMYICNIHHAERCPYARYVMKRDVHIQDISRREMFICVSLTGERVGMRPN
jgi:predicted transcriptional regulator